MLVVQKWTEIATLYMAGKQEKYVEKLVTVTLKVISVVYSRYEQHDMCSWGATQFLQNFAITEFKVFLTVHHSIDFFKLPT